MTHQEYTSFFGNIIIKGKDVKAVTDCMYDHVTLGYRIKHFPRKTYLGFGNEFICRLEAPKGALENRMDGERW